MLEFIRKHSWIALGAIAAILVGFLLMDYAGKDWHGSDHVATVNDKNYGYAEQVELGENGTELTMRLFNLCSQREQELLATCIVDEKGTRDETKLEAVRPLLEANRAAQQLLQGMYSLWASFGYNSKDSSAVHIRFMTNRAIAREEAKVYGVTPDQAQTDTFIANFPAFQNDQGHFDVERYKNFIGQREGKINQERETAFHALVADAIAWNALSSIIAGDIKANETVVNKLLDVKMQKFDLSMARLLRSKFAPTTEPAEEEIKAFWEQNKNSYLSDERRGVTVYTITPGKDVKNDENYRSDIEELYETIMEANGRAIAKQLETAAKKAGSEFTFKEETYPLAALGQMAEPLKTGITGADKGIETIADAAFTVQDAPAPAVYEERKAAGIVDTEVKPGQIRGVYLLKDGNYAIVRVNAIEKPTPLPYEQAKASALTGLKQKLTSEKLLKTAEELYGRMEKAEALDKAFTIAKEGGAEVSSLNGIGAQSTLDMQTPLALDLNKVAVTDTGKLAPIMEDEEGILVVGVYKRTVEDSREQAAMRTNAYLPMADTELQQAVLSDWLRKSYAKYGVQYAPHLSGK